MWDVGLTKKYDYFTDIVFFNIVAFQTLSSVSLSLAAFVVPLWYISQKRKDKCFCFLLLPSAVNEVTGYGPEQIRTICVKINKQTFAD